MRDDGALGMFIGNEETVVGEDIIATNVVAMDKQNI